MVKAEEMLYFESQNLQYEELCERTCSLFMQHYEKEWVKISLSQCTELTYSDQKCLFDVIAAKGAMTNYLITELSLRQDSVVNKQNKTVGPFKIKWWVTQCYFHPIQKRNGPLTWSGCHTDTFPLLRFLISKPFHWIDQCFYTTSR